MNAGSVMMRQHYTDLFESRLPYIDEIMFEVFDAPTLTYPSIFNVRDSSRAYEEITGVSGFGYFDEKPEGDRVTYDKPLQGYDKRFTHKTWAKGHQISFEAMDDDLDGVISNVTPALSRAARATIETLIFSVLNNGFSTSYPGPDGAALFSNSHPLLAGVSLQPITAGTVPGTGVNLVSGDLSVATLESAINLMDMMVDDRGLKIEVTPTRLVIPTQLKWLAHEILKSQLRSDTANNATNAFNMIGLDIVTSKYLTGDDDWILSADPSQTRLIVYWRQEPMSDHTLDFDTRNMKSLMLFRMSYGHADWRGVVGGQGA